MSKEFITIASSLPRIGDSFRIAEPPISRLQLEKRLKLLPDEYASLLFKIEFLVWQSWFKPKYSVLELQKVYKEVHQIDSLFIQELIDWYLNLRSLMAALRLRQVQQEPPNEPNEEWISSNKQQLIAHWHEPDFGLKAIYPWLNTINNALAQKDTARVEEFLLTYLWQYLLRKEIGHYFDFESLVIYLLRWDLVNYWSQFNKTDVLKTIDDLCDSLLASSLDLEKE
ncbi:DUF2764 family protein [Legionella sp. km772]|jgi:hypothetical protein|uniref:DUF2764 family protein n=1 Tax=Legionella sp. km772 TaxID=2498111 RepID=UPI000F8EDB24|nr:DUF2764 family protein [Legionella sp. km772]RUR08348.1 DUF2764 family protein [Legionella sp. km772]